MVCVASQPYPLDRPVAGATGGSGIIAARSASTRSAGRPWMERTVRTFAVPAEPLAQLRVEVGWGREGPARQERGLQVAVVPLLLPSRPPGAAAARRQHQDRTAHMTTEAISIPCPTHRSGLRKLRQSQFSGSCDKSYTLNHRPEVRLKIPAISLPSLRVGEQVLQWPERLLPV